MEKVAVFVDVQNIYYTVKQEFNCHFDYNAFWTGATSGRTLLKAIAYATDRGDSKQGNFQNILRRIGFEVKLKPYLQRRDGSTKGDWDVGITLDMVELAKDVDIIVLASGDGDYTDAVQQIIERHGVQFEVYGVKTLTSALLIKTATRYFSIDGKYLLPIPKTW